MLTVLGGLAEFERSLILARTGEGRSRAKASRPRSATRPSCPASIGGYIYDPAEAGTAGAALVGAQWLCTPLLLSMDEMEIVRRPALTAARRLGPVPKK